MSVLVGRDSELAVLDAALARARAGSGGLVVISGEPGIGKSRLAQGVITRADAVGMATHRGYALDDPGAPPLWPWARLGRDIAGVRNAMVGGSHITTDDAARFGLFEAVADALADTAADCGLVVLFEDLHWADPTTLQLLRHVSADLPRLPLLFVVTARDPMPETPWAAAIPELLRGSATTSLALQGLTASAVAQWLRASPGRREWADHAEQLVERSGGNPFTITMLTTVPPVADGLLPLDRIVSQRPDLRAVIAAQWAGLSPDCLRTVEVAALLGEHISTPVLAAATGSTPAVTDAHLAAAAAGGVLRQSVDGLTFAHALVRDSVAATIPADRAAEWHRAIAVALESVGDHSLAGSIAEHWRQVPGTDPATRYVLWSRRAARIAANGFAHERAAEYAERALKQARLLDFSAAELAEMTVELAERQVAASALQEAIGSCLQAADLAESAGRPDLLARAALMITGIGGPDLHRITKGLARRALDLLPADETRTRARLLAQLAVAESETGGETRAAELAVEALRVAGESGDSQAELEALAARHLTITSPETVEEREQLARRAIELGRTAAQPMSAVWGHLWLVAVYLQRGELARIDDELAAIDHIAAQRRSPLVHWHSHRIRAARAALVGEFEVALRYNDESLQLATRMGDVSMMGIYHAFNVTLGVVRGESSLLGDDVVAMFRAVPPIPLIRTLLVIMLLTRGQREEAAAIFDELRFLVDNEPVGSRSAATVSTIGIAAVLLGDAEVAERVFQVFLPTAGYCNGDGSGTVFSSGSNARTVADLALTAGRVDEAVGLYADAVIVNSRIGARPFVALSRLGRAQALRRRAMDRKLTALRSASDLPLAADLTRQAAAEFRRLGMPGPLRVADQLLIALTADIRHDNPLTVRESEIAGLVGKGMSNRLIAERLVLSERTVESHVRNILAKLNLRTRADIVRWVGRQ